MDKAASNRRYVTGQDGSQLAVYEGGVKSGPAIVFVHGYLFSASVFREQFLGTLAESCRLIAIDLRGHGATEWLEPPSRANASAMWASDIEAVMNALDVPKALLVGWSLGSRVVMNYAWHHGFDRIAGLNLVAATLNPGAHGPHAGLPDHLRPLLSHDESIRLDATANFIDDCFAPDIPKAEDRHAFIDAAMSVPVSAREGSKGWLIPYSPDFSWIKVPTLITHGRSDPLVEVETALSYEALIPGTTIDMMTSVGHLAFLQDPAKYNSRLRDFALSLKI